MTRKEFLQALGLFGFATLSGGSLLSSCGQKEEAMQTARQPAKAKPAPKKPADPCADVSGLNEAELKMRNETLKYVARSPEANKLCDNCKFWEPPTAGEFCGGCELIKGPINPKGYCTSWFEQEA